MATGRPPAPPRLPKNALRTILFVASRGVVGRTELGEFQRSLPEGDWRDLALSGGWNPIKPILSWSRIALPETRCVPIRVIVETLLAHVGGPAREDAKNLIEDLRHLLGEREAGTISLLEQVVPIPRTELAVKLGQRRSAATLAAYDDALRACADATERQRFESRMDFTAAARAVHAAVAIVRPTVLYEAVDHRGVARAVLAKKKSLQLHGARFEVIFSLGDSSEVHRLYVLSRLTRRGLAETLGIPSSWLRRSDHSKTGVELAPLPDVEAKLRRASRSRARDSRP